jgi:alkylhydroperoxidase family enzyme
VARIPFADIETPETRSLASQIAAERGSVLELYRMLLHSPPVAAGWLRYLTAIRQQCALRGALRELIIMRIAILNEAPYEAEQHVPMALREGLSTAQLRVLDCWHQSDQFESRRPLASVRLRGISG